MSLRKLTYGAALREATADAMAADKRVLVLGQGVDDAGGLFGSTLGLAEQFGAHRVKDTPLSEEALTGVVNGAALAGLKPILVHARVEFMLLAMDQILNHAAKWRSMFGPDQSMPVVYRAVIGRGWGQGAQHSQALPSLFMNVPGLKLVMPATPADAKGLLASAILDSDPTVVIEHRQLYSTEGPVPTGLHLVPLGRARVARSGGDLTIVAYSQMLPEALLAAEQLATEGIDCEVVDPRTLYPLDADTIMTSVEKTRRLLAVDYGWTSCGPSAEILARATEAGTVDWLSPPARLGFPNVPTPSSHVLEEAYYPHGGTIAAEARRVVQGQRTSREGRADTRSFSESW